MKMIDLEKALRHAGIPTRPVLKDADLAYLAEAADDPRPLPIRFGAALRQKPRLSAASLARGFNITRQRLSPSKIAHLSNEMIGKLARKLDVEFEWLLRGHSDQEPDFLLPYRDLQGDWFTMKRYAAQCGRQSGDRLRDVCDAIPNLRTHSLHTQCNDIVTHGIVHGNTFPFGQFPKDNPVLFNQFQLRWSAANLLSFPSVMAAAKKRSAELNDVYHDLRLSHRQVELVNEALKVWTKESTAEEYAEFETDVGQVEHLVKFALRFDLD